jgi:hypothetical protein
MGVVIEICVKHPGGRTRKKGTDMTYRYITILYKLSIMVWYGTVYYK